MEAEASCGSMLLAGIPQASTHMAVLCGIGPVCRSFGDLFFQAAHRRINCPNLASMSLLMSVHVCNRQWRHWRCRRQYCGSIWLRGSAHHDQALKCDYCSQLRWCSLGLLTGAECSQLCGCKQANFFCQRILHSAGAVAIIACKWHQSWDRMSSLYGFFQSIATVEAAGALINF